MAGHSQPCGSIKGQRIDEKPNFMRKLLTLFHSVLMVIISESCITEKDCCVPPPHDDQSLTGSWLLYESGYSPGAGYITEEVPPFPAQTVTFHSGNKLSSNIEGLSDYNFYRVLDDEYSDDKVVGIYKTNPGNPHDPLPYEHSYTIKFKDGNLFLHFRYCIEGCHMAFLKI